MRARNLISGAGLAALASALILLGGPANAGSGGSQSTSPAAAVQPAAVVPALVSVELCAKAGSITLPGAGAVDIWGYALKPLLTDCSDPSVVPALPGPVINAIPGVPMNVTLHNELTQPTSIVFPGSSAEPVEVAPGDSHVYSFSAAAGTYLYQSGSNVPRQVPMGLYGALVVDVSTILPGLPGQAYTTPASAYDAQAVLVLSEIDPELNADPAGFNLLDWAPTYWLINGRAYPETAEVAGAGGSRVLLRYVNASLDHHTMALLGSHQRIIAKDADPLASPMDVVAETIPAGSTADMIVTMPTAEDGTKLPLYNRQLRITNGNSFPGGQLTFLTVDSAAGPASVGIVPRLATLRALVRGHTVRVVARTTNCKECKGRVKMRVRGQWRKVRMVSANGRLVARFAHVPSGRWRYVVTITDAATGVRVTTRTQRVRVR
jgi:FtsP/CotA-like multicopper oxidase with cupredoxin domain